MTPDEGVKEKRRSQWRPNGTVCAADPDRDPLASSGDRERTPTITHTRFPLTPPFHADARNKQQSRLACSPCPSVLLIRIAARRYGFVGDLVRSYRRS